MHIVSMWEPTFSEGSNLGTNVRVVTICGANKILPRDDGRVQIGGVVGTLCDIPEVIAKDPRLGVGLGEEGAVGGSNTSQEGDAPGGGLVEEHAGSVAWNIGRGMASTLLQVNKNL